MQVFYFQTLKNVIIFFQVGTGIALLIGMMTRKQKQNKAEGEMLGTNWAAPSEGAKIADLMRAVAYARTIRIDDQRETYNKLEKLASRVASGINHKTNLELTDFPSATKLMTYQGREKKLTAQKAKTIAAKLNFPEEFTEADDIFLGTFYIWNSETHSLSVALDANQIIYSLNLFSKPAPQEGQLPTSKRAQNFLEELLAQLDLTIPKQIKWQKEEYLIQSYNFIPTSEASTADFIKVGFNPALEEYQLVKSLPQEPLVSLIIGKNETLVRFQYQIYFDQFIEKESFNLKTEKEVASTLHSEGEIVYLGTMRETTKIMEIKRAVLEEIQLAYFLETEKNPLIQPIYILRGTAWLENSDQTEVIVLLPAIASECLEESEKPLQKEEEPGHFEINPFPENLSF